MTKTPIAQQIDSILQKRQPTVAKITQSQQSVQSLLDSFAEMETLKEIFVQNQSNTGENRVSLNKRHESPIGFLKQ